jgi:hypothetical protein
MASFVSNLQYRTVSVSGMERCPAVKDKFLAVLRTLLALILNVYMESMFSCESFTSVFNLCSHNSKQLRVANVLTYNFWNNISPVKMLLIKDKKI